LNVFCVMLFQINDLIVIMICCRLESRAHALLGTSVMLQLSFPSINGFNETKATTVLLKTMLQVDFRFSQTSFILFVLFLIILTNKTVYIFLLIFKNTDILVYVLGCKVNCLAI